MHRKLTKSVFIAWTKEQIFSGHGVFLFTGETSSGWQKKEEELVMGLTNRYFTANEESSLEGFAGI
jgi:hypothetical protein